MCNIQLLHTKVCNNWIVEQRYGLETAGKLQANRVMLSVNHGIIRWEKVKLRRIVYRSILASGPGIVEFSRNLSNQNFGTSTVIPLLQVTVELKD